ncbi:50S ribosomal protein L21 [Texas Phoenix palm phytoplasma]|uniref:Large ribosomal subunit protein bL21 n=1 Tax=Texas Phoenix palm phytoplasma TaxID=176709 RepID=A0ABS5BIP9_9MOLU|nr:50S ribosomal protein L21 [Texas Phoenix palm phytoplasma]MBP3059463.1 50S ribosomal protein L21 [Texas Phoenix palm phytoplasma]
MFAIVQNGTKQFKVFCNQELFVDRLPINIEEEYIFENILSIEDEENKKTIIGKPFVAGARVECKVVKHGKASKIIVFKYKKKKKYRLKKGHRQLYTKLLVTRIIF